MSKYNEEFFKSFPVSIKGFFLNQYDSVDSGKNYLVPVYQRRYVWTLKLVKKLIDDIRECSYTKELNSSSPYFIGGVVLCKELTQQSEPYLSLEIIDGQQRLTTLSMIIASLYYQLKFHTERDLSKQKAWVDNQIDVIDKLLFSTKEIPGSFDINVGLTIERSDELQHVYSDILIAFKEGDFKEKFKSKAASNRYEGISKLYCEKIINAAILIEDTLTSFEGLSLLEFCTQLLDFTYIVVTKTIDIDTGFLVFEKLNDSGSSLEPEDLLKSFLFSESTDKEYEDLNKEWRTLIDLIESINIGKAKITPREFLDNYLIIKGLESGEMDKTKIFKIFKEYVNYKKLTPNDLVLDLIKIAKKYKQLKRDSSIKNFLLPFNFKLGYLILLTYYSKMGETIFNENKFQILKNLVRLEFAYILSGNSRYLGGIVKDICAKIISSSDYDIQIFIDEKITLMEDKFNKFLQTSNIFTKKNASKLLLKILNYHLGDITDINDYKVITLIPEKFDSNYNYALDKDTYPLNVYRLGNLTLVPKNISIENKKSFDENIELIINNKPTELSKYIYSKVPNQWSRNSIDMLSEDISKKAHDIFIKGELDCAIFS